MIFLANRANLDKRTLLTRIHNRLQTRVDKEHSPVVQVWYHPSNANKVGVRATINAPSFLRSAYPVEGAELHIVFAFPPNHPYDFYSIQWVEPARDLMIGWHQDETHMDHGECHLQLDFRGETVQREPAAYRDSPPLNVFETRIDQLGALLKSLTWDHDVPTVPAQAVR